nr:sporulation protein YqfC [Proteiniborus ethanoligenes]
MKRKINELKSNVSEILELPKDITLDLPKITMIGNIQLYIENHKGIIEYGSTRIRINTNGGIIRIIGKKMIIKTIITEEIIIYGEIEAVEFAQ